MSGTKGAPRPAGSWPGWCQRCARPMVKGSGTWCAACGTTDADDGNYGGGFEWLYSQIATLTAQRDAARDIAARLEGELARVREIVTAWSLGQTHRDEMVLWAIRDIVGLTPAKPDNPTPWPHPDAVIAEGES